MQCPVYYILLFFMMPICAMDLNQEQKKALIKTFDQFINILKSSSQEPSVSSFIPEDAQKEFMKGLDLLEKFSKTLPHEPVFELLPYIALSFHNAHETHTTSCYWSNKKKKHIEKKKKIVFPLAAYACAVACNFNGDFQSSLALLKKAYNPYLTFPLSICIPKELMSLAFRVKFEPAQEYLRTHPEIIKQLKNDEEKNII